MARTRIKLNGGLAVVVIVGLMGFFYLIKPAEFRRDPVTELAGLVRVFPTYEARYSGCADGQDLPRRGLAGLVPAFLGYHGARFVAADDEAARAFARAARPDCRLWGLDRFRRHYFEDGFSKVRRSRVRVPLEDR